MVLDHQAAQLWAAHGAQWSDDMTRLARGVTAMLVGKLETLRQAGLAVAALVISTAFVGVAVLPGYVG